jgi:hypothetical protein
LSSLGYFKGLPIYSRKAVHVCRTKNQWYRDHVRTIKTEEMEHPIRTAVYDKRGKMKAGSSLPVDDTHLPMQLYGIWQTEVFIPPLFKTGDPLPKNDHGAHTYTTCRSLHCLYLHHMYVSTLQATWRCGMETCDSCQRGLNLSPARSHEH